jgi:hypothetical protein
VLERRESGLDEPGLNRRHALAGARGVLGRSAVSDVRRCQSRSSASRGASRRPGDAFSRRARRGADRVHARRPRRRSSSARCAARVESTTVGRARRRRRVACGGDFPRSARRSARTAISKHLRPTCPAQPCESGLPPRAERRIRDSNPKTLIPTRSDTCRPEPSEPRRLHGLRRSHTRRVPPRDHRKRQRPSAEWVQSGSRASRPAAGLSGVTVLAGYVRSAVDKGCGTAPRSSGRLAAGGRERGAHD